MRLMIPAIIALAALSAPGCVSQGAPGLTAREAAGIVDAGRGGANLTILDVRTPEEYSGGHIEGAVNIDYYGKGFREELSRLDRSGTYLVYCRTGRRSAEAAAVMTGMGFNRTYDLAGGIESWKAAGYPLTG